MINNITTVTNPDRTPSLDFIREWRELEARVVRAEAKLAAIAAITAPAGGATIDSQARTAINAIIAGAS